MITTVGTRTVYSSVIFDKRGGPDRVPSIDVGSMSEDDSDEPPLSGSGVVNRECPDNVLSIWGDVLGKWRKSTDSVRPKELTELVRAGIPDALRGEVWQLLAKVDKDTGMLDTYRVLIAKDCPCENVILRDIHRTFPAHDYFKEAGGIGQDALYKLSKAYSLYDEEIGYCQGLSFLAASLLLHMPEEQAFCLLVKIMFDYGLRELFKQGFEELQLRFHQLERYVLDSIPDLHQHFSDINIEAHMYASQWFLTLFTAKFPLSMVFHIIDLFLSEGMNTIFNISIALLKASKKELLQLDFEGVLKYFRVILPRKYRSEACARELIMQAVRVKVSSKRLAKYEKEYIAWKQQEAESQDPMERLQRENTRLSNSVLRLERENDDLAHELVTSKIQLRKQLDAAEDNIESLSKQVEQLTQVRAELEEENAFASKEAERVKEMCRRELQTADEESTRTQSIIKNYKQICSDLSNRLEKVQTDYSEERKKIFLRLRDCESCSKELVGDGTLRLNDHLINGDATPEDLDLAERVSNQDDHIRRLELELAQTKLVLVETQCRSQDIMHELNVAQQELAERRTAASSTWLSKTKSSIKEVAAKVSSQTTTNTSQHAAGGATNNNNNNTHIPPTGTSNSASGQSNSGLAASLASLTHSSFSSSTGSDSTIQKPAAAGSAIAGSLSPKNIAGGLMSRAAEPFRRTSATNSAEDVPRTSNSTNLGVTNVGGQGDSNGAPINNHARSSSSSAAGDFKSYVPGEELHPAEVPKNRNSLGAAM